MEWMMEYSRMRCSGVAFRIQFSQVSIQQSFSCRLLNSYLNLFEPQHNLGTVLQLLVYYNPEMWSFSSSPGPSIFKVSACTTFFIVFLFLVQITFFLVQLPLLVILGTDNLGCISCLSSSSQTCISAEQHCHKLMLIWSSISGYPNPYDLILS